MNLLICFAISSIYLQICNINTIEYITEINNGLILNFKCNDTYESGEPVLLKYFITTKSTKEVEIEVGWGSIEESTKFNLLHNSKEVDITQYGSKHNIKFYSNEYEFKNSIEAIIGHLSSYSGEILKLKENQSMSGEFNLSKFYDTTDLGNYELYIRFKASDIIYHVKKIKFKIVEDNYGLQVKPSPFEYLNLK